MACDDCHHLAKRLEELERRLAETTAKLEESLRKEKRQANPFAKDQKKPKDQHKKPGRPPGHVGAHRKPPNPSDVDQVISVPLNCCPCCGGDVIDVKAHEHYVVDLPPITPKWTKYISHAGHCADCGQWCSSKHPELPSLAVGAANTSLGNNFKALIAQLRAQTGASLGKIARLLREWFQLPLSRSETLFALRRISEALTPSSRRIQAKLQSSRAVNVDETGWRVLGESSWVWVVANKDATLYHIDKSRGHEVVLRLLGEKYNGVLHSDFLRTYDALTGFTKSKCTAHLLKHIRDLAKIQDAKTHKFPASIKKIFKSALALRASQSDLACPTYAARVDALNRKLDRLLVPGRRDLYNRRLRNRLVRHRGDVLRFLTDPRAEATNNLAERQIRPTVLMRKICGGHRSEWGPKAHSVLLSVYATSVQQGKRFGDFVFQTLCGRQPDIFSSA